MRPCRNTDLGQLKSSSAESKNHEQITCTYNLIYELHRYTMKLEHELKQTKPFKSEVQKLLINISFTSSWISTIMTNKLKPFDITPTQYNVLRILKGKHPEAYSNLQIVERMIDKSSNVTRIVDKLVNKKLAIRSEGIKDKRSVQISISELGISMIDNIEGALDNSLEWFSEFDNAKAKLMNDWLEEFREKGTI